MWSLRGSSSHKHRLKPCKHATGTIQSEERQRSHQSAQGTNTAASSLRTDVLIHHKLQAAKYVMPSNLAVPRKTVAPSHNKPSMGVFIPISDASRLPHYRIDSRNIEDIRATMVKDADRSRARKIAGKDLDVALSRELTWIEEFDGNTEIGNDSVACCHATLIRRHEISFVFHEALASTTPEASSMAFELFDRFGRLKDEFRKHPTKKGSGVWQDEMDRGDLLLISYLVVDGPPIQFKIGHDLLLDVLKQAHARSEHFFAIANLEAIDIAGGEPVPELPSTNEKSTWHDGGKKTYIQRNRSMKEGIDLLRVLGFRRIGSTDWFAAASDPTHKSHALPSEDDFNLDRTPGDVPRLETLGIQLSQDEVGSAELYVDPSVVFGLLKSLPLDDKRWYAVDEHGYNYLHLLLLQFDHSAVDIFVSRNPGLRLQKNSLGETPLEALQCQLETLRTQREDKYTVHPISDDFHGHNDKAVRCLLILQDEPRTENLRRRLKYGCTCGCCQSGFISGRMRLGLMYQAILQHDRLKKALNTEDGPTFAKTCENMLLYTPLGIRERIKTSLPSRQVFVELVSCFAAFLMGPQPAAHEKIIIRKEVPDVGVVLTYCLNTREWPAHMRQYLEASQLHRAIVSAIFLITMCRDEIVGDGTVPDEFKYSLKKYMQPWKATYRTLPRCRNDFEYGFVSSMLGYEKVNYRRFFMDGFLWER